MNGGFRRCRHKKSPDQYLGLQSFDTNNCASSTRFNFFRKVLKTFSRYINGRRFAHCGIPSLTFRFGCPHLAQVCWRGLSLKVHLSAPVSWCWKIECHLVLPLLRTHCWVLVDVSASVSCRWMKHNSDPILDSLCCLDHSNLAEDLSSQSRGSLTPNSLVSVSPLPNLLLSV